jgi:hypothetical protein
MMDGTSEVDPPSVVKEDSVTRVDSVVVLVNVRGPSHVSVLVVGCRLCVSAAIAGRFPASSGELLSVCAYVK